MNRALGVNDVQEQPQTAQLKICKRERQRKNIIFQNLKNHVWIDWLRLKTHQYLFLSQQIYTVNVHDFQTRLTNADYRYCRLINPKFYANKEVPLYEVRFQLVG